MVAGIARIIYKAYDEGFIHVKRRSIVVHPPDSFTHGLGIAPLALTVPPNFTINRIVLRLANPKPAT